MQYLANNQYGYVTKFTSESLLARNESYKIDSSNGYESPLAVLLSVDFTGVIAIIWLSLIWKRVNIKWKNFYYRWFWIQATIRKVKHKKARRKKQTNKIWIFSFYNHKYKNTYHRTIIVLAPVHKGIIGITSAYLVIFLTIESDLFFGKFFRKQKRHLSNSFLLWERRNTVYFK